MRAGLCSHPLAVEAVSVMCLAALLVRWEALMGRSEEQLQSGISSMEQVIWNMQKCLRCALFILCFSSAFLRQLPQKAHSWPSLAFAYMAQDLWLLSDDESPALACRRWACFTLMAVTRAALGTIRTFLQLRKEGTSTPVIAWIMLLDVAANCGFLFAFFAGRSYFATAAKEAMVREANLDPEKEAMLKSHGHVKLHVLMSYNMPMNRPAPIRKHDASVGTADGADIPTESGPGGSDPGLDGSARTAPRPPSALSSPGAATAASPFKSWEHPRSGWEQLQDMFQDPGPIFREYARFAFVGLVLASVLECCSLQHWEAGILGHKEDEVDIFHHPGPYFISYTPDLSRWRARRVVLGSWRDIIYLALVHPGPCTVAVASGLGLNALASKMGWQVVQYVLRRVCVGALTYFVLLSAHRAYFVLICLLVCWECRDVELKALGFARVFAQLSPSKRWQWHSELGGEIKALDDRLAPLISYACLQRVAYLFLDLARQSRDSGLPFNWVHYLFRHVMFLSALALTFWRIGKLNFAFYEKLHNTIMDLYPHNWADLGRPGVTQNDVQLQRMHLDDWRHYLSHNIESGRREACVCVLHLRWAAKSHVLALSILTVITLPLVNRAMESYGRHVVNERLLAGPTAGAVCLAGNATCMGGK